MSKRKWLVAAGILIVFLGFALVRFPVALAAGFLPATLQLTGGEGTVWQGRASALGLGGMAVQHDIAWQLQPQRLLRGQLAWEIKGKFAAEQSRLTLAVSPNAVEVRDMQVALPLEPLLAQDAKLKPLRLGGMLKLQSVVFTLQRPSELSARVENLFSALVPGIGALGNTQIQLSVPNSQAASWAARPEDGPMAINGEGTLDLKRGKVAGKLTFKPDNKLAGSLRPILSLLQQDANGEYTLALPSS